MSVDLQKPFVEKNENNCLDREDDANVESQLEVNKEVIKEAFDKDENKSFSGVNISVN